MTPIVGRFQEALCWRHHLCERLAPSARMQPIAHAHAMLAVTIYLSAPFSRMEVPVAEHEVLVGNGRTRLRKRGLGECHSLDIRHSRINGGDDQPPLPTTTGRHQRASYLLAQRICPVSASANSIPRDRRPAQPFCLVTRALGEYGTNDFRHAARPAR